jgi:hypothetical protein
MPLNVTHNRFGDYTPLSRTPSSFKGQNGGSSSHDGLAQGELHDRPHFGLEESPRIRISSRRFNNKNDHSLSQ